MFATIGHPVTWIGAAISALDRTLNRETDSFDRRRRQGGIALVVVLLLSGAAAFAVTIIAFFVLPGLAAILVLGLAASSCLAQRSLASHVRAVADALDRDGIEAARRAVGAIVGRDTAALDEAGIARAAIESLAENFADGIVAPAFWLGLLGLPGGVLYKAINTADSMIGHRTARHAAFGFYAAKTDDVANWPAARLAALWLVAAARFVSGASWRDAWRIMWRDAKGHASPNAGWPEAAMAGALGIRLGGARLYAGRRVEDAGIGDGDRRLDASAIRHGLRVYCVACGLQFVTLGFAACIIARWS